MAEASRNRKALFVALSLTVAVLLGLLMLELVLRAGYLRPEFTDPRGIGIALDRDLLYKFLPNTRKDFNALGYRDREFDYPVPEGARRVIFLGDSFIMALHVRPFETMPKMLEQMSEGQLDVLNMGMYSYGPDQSLIQLEREGFDLKPDMVILGLYPSNDFNDLIMNHLYELDSDDRLVRTRKNAVTEAIPRLEVMYQLQYQMFKRGIGGGGDLPMVFYRMFGEQNNDPDFVLGPDEPAEYKVRLMKAVLESMRDELRQRGIRFMVMIIPSVWNMEKTETMVKEGWPEGTYFTNEDLTEKICLELGIETVNLYKVFQSREHPALLYDHADNHLSVYGHTVAVRALIDRIFIR